MKYRYYMLFRPPMPGAIPKGACEVVDFPDKRYCPEVDRTAWGYVEYEQPLSPQEVVRYEMAVAGSRVQ